MRTALLLALATLVGAAAGQTPLELHKAKAGMLLAQMDFAGALSEAQAANRASPDDVAAYQLMAAAQIELGDYAEAEKQLQWMLDLRIGKADAAGWLLVARFREATGDLDGALEAVNLGFARAPPDGPEREALAAYAARLLCSSGKLDLAERTIEPVAAGPSAPAAVLESLARLRMAQGRAAEANRVLRQLIERAPHPRYLYLLAPSNRRR
jgi:Flp pilus assembly protein TadD